MFWLCFLMDYRNEIHKLPHLTTLIAVLCGFLWLSLTAQALTRKNFRKRGESLAQHNGRAF